MNTDSLVVQFKQMPWEVWLHRRFYPFVAYLMLKNGTREGFASQGIHGEFPIALYDTDDWYSTPEMFAAAGKEASSYLQEKDIFVLTRQCEDAIENSRVVISHLLETQGDPLDDFRKVIKAVSPVNVYIFVAHGADAYYHGVLREAVRAHVRAEEAETFIGDLSFPSKKNAHALMEDDIHAGVSLDELYKRYAWIKARGGFQPGYTVDEMQEIQQKVLSTPRHDRHLPRIPDELHQLAREVQELVYLRTLRTDALYELYHLAQPIFHRFEKSIGIESVKDYVPDELLAGRIEKVPHAYAILKHHDEVVVLRESIVSQTRSTASEVRGVVAQKGTARGVVRILHTVADMGKVQDGDILVTNMTIPAYLIAMRKAAAFVTNEGGITCHAAILAREMRKPCVIGTKVATQVFVDGDMVEVDAERGIVRKV